MQRRAPVHGHVDKRHDDELSTSSALRLARRSSARYARMVGSPASASPSDEYTGERLMESRRFTSRTDACPQRAHC